MEKNNLQGYKPSQLEEESELSIVPGFATDVLKTYQKWLEDLPNRQGFQGGGIYDNLNPDSPKLAPLDGINEILTPDMINSCLPYFAAFEDHEFFQNTGYFIGKLVKNSQRDGHWGFEFHTEGLPPLHHFCSNLQRPKMIDTRFSGETITIHGSVGPDSLGRRAGTNVILHGDVGQASLSELLMCDVEVFGTVGAQAAKNSDSSRFIFHNNVQKGLEGWSCIFEFRSTCGEIHYDAIDNLYVTSNKETYKSLKRSVPRMTRNRVPSYMGPSSSSPTKNRVMLITEERVDF